MCEVTSETSVQSSGPLRMYALPWLAGLLTWLVVTWTVGLIISGNPGAENVTAAVAAAWIGLLVAPVLSAAVAVILLPEVARGSSLQSLLVGTPVVLAIVVWRVLTVDPQGGQGAALVGAALVVIVAAAVSLVVAAAMRRWR